MLHDGEGEQVDPFALLHALPDPVVVVDDQARLVWANALAEEVFGLSLSAVRGAPVDTLVHRDDLPTALVSLVSVQEKRVGTPVTIRVRDRSGDYRHVEVRGRTAMDVPGVRGIVLVLRDVSDRHRWNVAAGDPALLGAIVDNAAIVTMVLDAEGTVRGATRAFTRLLGHPIETTLGRRLSELAAAGHGPTVDAELALSLATTGARTFEIPLTAADGRGVWVAITVVNLLDDRAVRGLVVSVVDIDELVAARHRLEQVATHDPLTGVLNRAALHDRLAAELHRASATRPVSVVFCDLDGFKAVNDSYGHRTGDRALTLIARRLVAVLQPGDEVGRFGGDEFVLVLPGDDGERARRAVDRLQAAMGHPVVLDGGQSVAVAMRAGILVADGTVALDADRALELADQAMYAAKRSGVASTSV